MSGNNLEVSITRMKGIGLTQWNELSEFLT